MTSLALDGLRRETMESWEEFKKYLDSTFGDPDRKNAARRASTKLKQTTLAAAYFVEVE